MMKRFISGICAAAMAASLLGTSAPAFAGPYRPAIQHAPAADIVKVDWRRHGWSHAERLRGVRTPGYWRHRDWGPRHWYGHRRWYGHRHWDRGDWPRYRHWRYYHRHYDDDDNFFGPAAGFLAGALLGGVIANSVPRATYGSSAHVRWCYSRYRSYRASDNTFQPYYGPRRQCISPYY